MSYAPETPECDRDVYKNGDVALMLSLRAKRMEPWVVRVRERSEQRVDWHYFGGRAIVKFIGDPEAVLRAISEETQSLIDLVLTESLVEYNMLDHYQAGAQIAQGYGVIPSIWIPEGAKLRVVDIDQETGTEIAESLYVTMLDAFLAANTGMRDQAVTSVDQSHGYTMEFAPSPSQHRDEYDSEEERLLDRVRALAVGDVAEFGGGAGVLTHVKRLS
jgi:hypothetical protein